MSNNVILGSVSTFRLHGNCVDKSVRVGCKAGFDAIDPFHLSPKRRQQSLHLVAELFWLGFSLSLSISVFLVLLVLFIVCLPGIPGGSMVNGLNETRFPCGLMLRAISHGFLRAGRAGIVESCERG